MSAVPVPQTTRQTVAQGFWALIGLSIIGFPVLIVLAIGVGFLLYVLRLVVLTVAVVFAAGAFVTRRLGHGT